MKFNSVLVTGANRGLGLEFVRQLATAPSPPKHIFATTRRPYEASVNTALMTTLLVKAFHGCFSIFLETTRAGERTFKHRNHPL